MYISQEIDQHYQDALELKEQRAQRFEELKKRSSMQVDTACNVGKDDELEISHESSSEDSLVEESASSSEDEYGLEKVAKKDSGNKK